MEKLNKISEKIKGYSAVRIIVGSFLFMILMGTLLLMLPFCARDGKGTDLLSSFFTATSCTCVTGLAVFDTWSHWSVYGQIVMLLLIQLGGLGLVSFATGFTLLFRGRLGLRDMRIFQECTSGNIIDISRLIKIIFISTILFEMIGAILLCIRLVPKFGYYGIWVSIFLAVSAYCNAGFDITGFISPGASLTVLNDDPFVLTVISLLIIIGGLGFIVMVDIYGYFKRKIESNNKNTHISVHTNIVLKVSIILLIIGTVLFFIAEYNNTMKDFGFTRRLATSFFQSSASRTAGFFAVDTRKQTDLIKFITIILMFIGASPSSTGGGVKTTTLAVMFYSVWSIFKGYDDTVLNGKKIEKSTVYKAMTVFVVFIFISCLGIICIGFAESLTNITIIDIIYEVISAISTTGLSTGITAGLSVFSKCLLAILMFIGRVGPISLVLSIMERKGEHKNSMLPEGKLVIG